MNSACIVCANKKHSPYATKSGYEVWKCAQCGTLFLYPLPKAEEAAAVYSQDYFGGALDGHGYVNYDADKEAMRTIFIRHLIHFEKLLGKPGKILDVGAATGFFMKIAKTRGWQVHGVEISAYAAEQGRKDGLDIVTGTLQNVKQTDNTFDLITMWDVIEHMPDPVSDLNRVRSLLKPGGLVAVNTPDSGSFYSKLMGSRWHLFVPPEHIWYFNRKSIATLLNNSGFEVLEIGCVGKKFTVEYVINFLYRWQGLVIWRKLSDRLKNTRIGKLYFSINLRDNMYVLAKKK